MAGTHWGGTLDTDSCNEFVESLLDVLDETFAGGRVEGVDPELCSQGSVNLALSLTRGTMVARVEIEVTPRFTEDSTNGFSLLIEAIVVGTLEHEAMILIADAITRLREKYSGILDIELRLVRVVRLSLR